MSQFEWVPDFGAQVNKKANVKKVAFGEGYEQRQTMGMNTVPQTWSVSFTNRDKADIDAIDDFLEIREGRVSFTWTTPKGKEILVVCEEWTGAIQIGNHWTLSGTFRQVFEPVA